MTIKCLWCKEKKEDDEYENPALGVCRDCNREAKKKHEEYLEWRKNNPQKRRRT